MAFHRRIEAMGGPRFEHELLVAADRSLPYGVLHQALEVASQQGFDHPMLLVLAP